MEFKFIAISMIIGISLYIAYVIKKHGNDKLRFCYSLIDLIAYIRNQISYFCTPTEEIFEAYSDGLLEDCGFLAHIRKNEWLEAVSSISYLDGRAKAILLSFASKLGKSSAQEQVTNCDYTIDALNKLLEEYKKDMPKKYKAYSSLAVIFGFMIIVLLI